MKGYYEKGEQTWWYYTKKGQLWKYGRLSGLYPIGEWKYYYDNGQLSEIGNYIGKEWDDRTGEWKSYHENGQLYQVQLWQNGKFMEIISCFDGKGNSLKKGNLRNGNGKVREYDIEGILLRKTTYRKGVEK